MNGLTPKRRTLALCAAAIAAAIFAAWWNAFGAALVFDDQLTVINNYSITSLADLWLVLNPPYELQTAGRPLPNLTFAINYALGGINPVGYHVANVLFHICSALALFFLLRVTLRTKPLADFAPHADALAFAAALLWGLHPLTTGAVTYVTQRTEVLASLFMLLALFTHARNLERERGGKAILLPPLFCLLAMASKEISAVLPVLALLYDRAFFAGSFRDALQKRWRNYAPLAACWGFQAFLMLRAGSRGGTVLAGTELTTVQYGLTQFTAIAKYLGLSFWPSPLVLDYGIPVARGFREIAPSAALVLALLALGAFAFWKNRPEGFAAAAFFCVLAPTSSVFPITDTVFEHRMYLPLTALVSLLVFAAWSLWTRLVKRSHLPLALLAALLAVALGAATHARNADYATPLSIWTDTDRKVPGNKRAVESVGNAWFELNNLPEAEKWFKRAVALDPTFHRARVNLSLTLAKQGKFREALPVLVKAAQEDPGDLKARFLLAATLIELGDAVRGFSELRAIAEDPGARARVVAMCAEEYEKRGQYAEAVRVFGVAKARAIAERNPELAAMIDRSIAKLRMRTGGGG